MGCGSGIQGIVMALYGARKVMFSDLSHSAIVNTKENIAKFHMENKSEVFQGNLFEKIRERADLIVFNHPFFSDHTIEQLLAIKSSIKRGNLIHIFLENAKLFLNKDGKIIMPYFHLAGLINNPEIQAPQHGYKVIVEFRKIINSGLQRGLVSIYEISIK